MPSSLATHVHPHGAQVTSVQKGGPYVMFGDGHLAACKPIAEEDLAAFMAECITDRDKINKVWPPRVRTLATILPSSPLSRLASPSRSLPFRHTGQQACRRPARAPLISIPLLARDMTNKALPTRTRCRRACAASLGKAKQPREGLWTVSCGAPCCAQVLPIGGPGEALDPAQQAEVLFGLLGKPPRTLRVPVALMDGVIGVLDLLKRVFPGLVDAAEFGRIGRYYATESMLVYDAATGTYDAAATPSYGTETLEMFFRRALKDGLAGQELGDQAVFGQK